MKTAANCLIASLGASIQEVRAEGIISGRAIASEMEKLAKVILAENAGDEGRIARSVMVRARKYLSAGDGGNFSLALSLSEAVVQHGLEAIKHDGAQRGDGGR